MTKVAFQRDERRPILEVADDEGGAARVLAAWAAPAKARALLGPARINFAVGCDKLGKMLRFLTAGESHGPCLTVVVEGLPAGWPVDMDEINRHLARRQKGYGRGGRMKIEKDRAEVRSGIRWGETLGSPVTLVIENRDWANWEKSY